MATIPHRQPVEYIETPNGPRRVVSTSPVFDIPTDRNAAATAEVAALALRGKLSRTVTVHKRGEEPIA